MTAPTIPDFEKRSAELLASAKRILMSKPVTHSFTQWRESMTKVLAKAKAAERKQVEARIGKAPKHARHVKEEASIEDSSTEATPAVEAPFAGFSAFNQTPVKESFMSTKDTTPKPDQAAIRAAAQEKREAKALAAAEKKAAVAAAKQAKADEAAAKKAAREEAKAKRAADKAAAEEAIRAAGGTYAGSMLALRDAKTRYVRATNGRLRSTDPLAEALDAVEPGNVVKLAKIALELESNPYAQLNVGQQSMNLRNKIRFAIRKGTLSVEDVIRIRDENDLSIPADVLAKREERRAAAAARKEAVAAAVAQ